MDLNELIKDLKPNVVTPHMDEILKVNPAARGNVMARYIIRGMAKQRGKIDPIDIMHDGEIKTVRFLDVEVLCDGPWALYSLMLLSVSYGEQSTVIEILYPKTKQLQAKAFAALFSHDSPVAPKRDQTDVLQAIENANAGIAMILTKLENTGPMHADTVAKQRSAMKDLAESLNRRNRYKQQFERSQQAFKSSDPSKK